MKSSRAQGFLDILLDSFWAVFDWTIGVSNRIELSRKGSSKRRRGRRGASSDDPSDVAEPAPEPRPDARNPQPTSAPDAAAQNEQPEGGISAPGRLRRPWKFRSAAKQPDPGPATFECESCGHANHPPILFCEACHHSFLSVSKTLLLGIISLALICFFSAEYFGEADAMQWPWPIYIFYSCVFLMINAALLRKAPAVNLTAFA